MYDKKLLHRYAMSAEELGREDEAFAGSIDINAVSAKLGIPNEQGRAIASYLGKIGWAIPNFAPDPPLLTLTPKGYEEIEKLGWTPWRQWLDKNLALAAFVLSGLALLVSLATFFANLFKK